MQYTAFDLEISTEIPEGTDDWRVLRPLGISCAATLTNDGDLKVWHGSEIHGGRLAAKMSPLQCQEMAQYLVEMQSSGYPVVTFNGLGFDFDVLAEEVQDLVTFDNLRALALAHIDIAFAMLCEKGYMCGLDAAAKGMRLSGKTEGMSGSLAPVMWAQGRAEQDKVLEYVAQDVRTTAEVYEAILKNHGLRWITKRGYPTKSPWRTGEILTVAEACQTPLPDTSWMDAAWPRSKFLGWTEQRSMADGGREAAARKEAKRERKLETQIPIPMHARCTR